MNHNGPMRRFLSILGAPAVIGAAIIVAPAASAETEFPDGSYAVPGDMAYGRYAADIAPGAAGCTYSTYDAQGAPMDTVSSFVKPLTAAVRPGVATFKSSGCTSWVRFSKALTSTSN